MFVWLPRFNYEPLYVVISLNNIQYFTKSVGKRSLFKKIKILYGFYLQLSLVWELSPVDTLYLQSCLSLSVSGGLKNSASFWLLKRKRGVKKCLNENKNICINISGETKCGNKHGVVNHHWDTSLPWLGNIRTIFFQENGPYHNTSLGTR